MQNRYRLGLYSNQRTEVRARGRRYMYDLFDGREAKKRCLQAAQWPKKR